MERELLCRFLDSCFEGKKIINLLPNPPKGLSQRHMKVIQTVRVLESGGNKVKISDVSHWMGGTRPSITKLINQLEEKGALVKEHDTADRRVIWLKLTPLGERYYEFYCYGFQIWLCNVLSEIPKDEFETTIHTVHRAYETLRLRSGDLKEMVFEKEE